MTAVDSTTKLLLHFNGSDSGTVITDSSVSEQVCTVTGTAVTSTTTPKFGSASAKCLTGYVEVVYNTDLRVYGDFCTEFWFKLSELTYGQYCHFLNGSGSGYEITISNYAGTPRLEVHIAGSTVSVWYDISAYDNDAWHHLEVSGSSLSWYVFLDGVVVASGTSATLWDTAADTSNWTIGDGTSGATFYIDEFRHASVAGHTTNFTPETAEYTTTLPLEPNFPGIDNYTVLLLHDGLTDSSYSAHTMSADGSAGFDNTASGIFERGFSSASASGFYAGGYVATASGADFNFSAGNFTIDCWYKASYGAYLHYLYRQYTDINNYIVLYIEDALVTFKVVSGGVTLAEVTTATQFIEGVWNHFALVRNGTAAECIKMYKSGTAVACTYTTDLAATALPELTSALRLCWGTFTSAVTESFTLDELRVSKGIARWTRNFIPPTGPYFEAEFSGFVEVVAEPARISMTAVTNCIGDMHCSTENPISYLTGFTAVLGSLVAVSESAAVYFHNTSNVSGNLAVEVSRSSFTAIGIQGNTGVVVLITQSCSITVTGLTANIGALTLDSESCDCALSGVVDIVGAMSVQMYNISCSMVGLISTIGACVIVSSYATYKAVGSSGNVGQFQCATVKTKFYAVSTHAPTVAYCLNLIKGGLVTTFTNYAYNSFAVINGKMLGSKSSGLFLMSGSTDNSTQIMSTITFPVSKLGSINEKQLRAIKVLGRTTGQLRVTATNGKTKSWSIDIPMLGDSTAESVVKTFPYTTRGRYIQISISNTAGCDFLIDQIELSLYLLGRA